MRETNLLLLVFLLVSNEPSFGECCQLGQSNCCEPGERIVPFSYVFREIPNGDMNGKERTDFLERCHYGNVRTSFQTQINPSRYHPYF